MNTQEEGSLPSRMRRARNGDAPTRARGDNSMHKECPTWTDCIADLSEELQVKEAWDNVEYWSLTQKLIKRCKNCPSRPKEAVTT